ncbi:MAG: serine/threonine-protein kinase [Lacipirellulaceae bacterium]
MSPSEADKLLDLVRKSELVPPERLDSVLDRLRNERGGTLPESQVELADLLIAADVLTRWQADKLLAGKHRGFKLGKYKLLGQIGKGGMSHVYLAEHILMRRRVAVKVLPVKRVNDRSYLQRFQLEARAAARLDDPNIVRVYDIDNDGDTHYIVMEYVEGRDLHQTVAADGPLPYEVAADYIAQVARGLEHAHQMGLVHRDIKPANCLVDSTKTIKLLDMGLAKLTDDETSLTLANDENVLGTADYLAPEQALNSHTADARADIYSLGCTLYFLLVGRPPFPEGSISERLLKHQVESPESILNKRHDCPLALVDICTRMMAKKPAERPQTAGDVANLLSDWLSGRDYVPVHGRPPLTGEGSGTGMGSGLGSGLGRFGQAGAPGSVGAAGSASGSGKGRGLGGNIAAMRTTPLPSSNTPPARSSATSDTEEDIGLAPIEDEGDDPRSRNAKKAASSSGVLSDESSPKVGGGSKKGGSGAKPGSSKASGSGSKASLSTTSQRPKSIFEEEYAKQVDDPIARRAAMADQYDPLHPPGYVNPYMRTPWYVWAGLGVGALALVGVVIALL